VPPEIFEDLHGFYGTDEAIDIIASLKTDWSDMMMPFYQRVAHHVTYNWNQNGNCCLVTGGTYPSEIAEIRKIAPNIPLLIPGIGKQGGDLEGSVHAARHRFVINSSSGVIFADDPRAEALKLHNQIQEALATIA
jgi:orotidine-5'-phosphate decarboxylase